MDPSNDTVATEETALDQAAVPEAPEGTSEGTSDFVDESTIQTQPPQAQQVAAEDHFLQGASLDPKTLPPELQPIFKRMQGAYTKKMQGLSQIREQAEIVNRFYNDRDFAFQTLAQWAAQNGYQISPVGAQQAQQAQQPTQQRPGQPPAQVVEALKSNLAPELQWMADSLAPALTTTMQTLLSPVVQQLAQQTQTVQQQVRAREYDNVEQQFAEKVPGWEQYEDEMTELLDFMQGQDFVHPKFGSKHELLYNLVTSNAAAQAAVTKRMQGAARNRPSSGITTGRTVSNLEERVRAAKSSQDAFKLAAQAARNATGM